MEDGALTLELLEDELLEDEDDHAAVAATMPPPSTTLFPDAPCLPRGSTSQPPPASTRGGHAGPSLGCGSSRSTSVATGNENIAPFVHKTMGKEIRKFLWQEETSIKSTFLVFSYLQYFQVSALLRFENLSH